MKFISNTVNTMWFVAWRIQKIKIQWNMNPLFGFIIPRHSEANAKAARNIITESLKNPYL